MTLSIKEKPIDAEKWYQEFVEQTKIRWRLWRLEHPLRNERPNSINKD